MLAIVITLLAAQSTVDAARPSVWDRWQAIRRENRTGAPVPWAGTYTKGSEDLWIAATSGAVISTPGCLGPSNRGIDVLAEDRRLTFSYDDFPHESESWWHVPWDGRAYLIPEAFLADFCAHVNEGIEPRMSASGFHDLRASDVGKPVRGLPDVPPRWRDLLLSAPIEARVQQVWRERGRREKGAPQRRCVLLPTGRERGVVPGLRFRAQGRDGRVARLEVVTASDHEAVLRVVEDPIARAVELSVGDLCFTGREPKR